MTFKEWFDQNYPSYDWRTMPIMRDAFMEVAEKAWDACRESMQAELDDAYREGNSDGYEQGHEDGYMAGQESVTE